MTDTSSRASSKACATGCNNGGISVIGPLSQTSGNMTSPVHQKSVPAEGTMKRFPKLTLSIGLLLTTALGQNKTSTTVTPADYLRWRTEYKNWGRWGADDQKGTTNLITPQKVLNAAKLVKNGIVISLAHSEPQKVEADVPAAGVFHRTTNAISATNTTD